jgi:integrase
LKAWADGVAEFGAPKTRQSRRKVALIPELVHLLADHLANYKPDDLVFQSMRGGGPVHQVAFMRNFFRPARNKVLPDHPNLRFHDLRHTFVSMLIAQNVNVKAIARQTGHTSAAMVLDTYGHLYNDDADRIVREALSAAYSQAQQPNVVPLREAATS